MAEHADLSAVALAAIGQDEPTAGQKRPKPDRVLKQPKLKLKKDALSKAVKELVEVVAKQVAGKSELADDGDQTVNLLFNMSSVPSKRTMKPALIPLPHPMYGSTSQVCFISRDPQKKYKELLMEKHPVPGVTKVIGLTKLRNDYTSHKDMCALADNFDLLLVDAAIEGMMRSVLGKPVYEQKKKQPIGITMTQDPTKEIQKAMNGTPLRVPATCPFVGVKIGRCGMPQEQLVANGLAVIKGVLSNVRENPFHTISLQAPGAPALPIWRRQHAAKPGESAGTSAAEAGADGNAKTDAEADSGSGDDDLEPGTENTAAKGKRSHQGHFPADVAKSDDLMDASPISPSAKRAKEA